MVQKYSRQFVVDASVARAAGGQDASAEVSKNCRDILLDLLSICHQAVITQEILDEWKKHQSNFSRKWRVQMLGRKKVKYRIRIKTKLRTIINELEMEHNTKIHILKDVHLFDAAIFQSFPLTLSKFHQKP